MTELVYWVVGLLCCAPFVVLVVLVTLDEEAVDAARVVREEWREWRREKIQ